MTLQSTSTSASPPSHVHFFRARTGLRPLRMGSDAQPFIPGEARHDRVAIKYTARVAVDPLNVEDVLSHMGPRDDEGLFVGTPRGASNVMRLASLRDASRKHLWLVTGEGTATWRPEGPFVDVDLRLQLNPTRFLAHQPDPAPASILARDTFEALRVDLETRNRLKIIALDRGDNVLVGLDRLGGQSLRGRSQLWRETLNAYMAHVHLMLRATVAPEHHGALLTSERLSVQQAEVYWELSEPNAVPAAADLARMIASADGSARIIHLLRPTRRPPCIEMGGTGNVRWCKLNLTDDISAKVYAKTEDRIRVEVAYTKRVYQSVGRVGGSNIDLVDQLLALRIDAASRLDTLWTAIMKLNVPQNTIADLCDFMARLNSVVPEENRRLIQDLLVSNPGLTVTSEDGGVPPAVCRALAREGILMRTAARRRVAARYGLAPGFSTMFDRLLNRDDASPGTLN